MNTLAETRKSPFEHLHNTKLSHKFYWHFHPALELVYIEGADGQRVVGDHISEYSESDLVLIGPDIPHVNIDHGVSTSYHKEILHLKPNFKDHILDALPELKQIDRLLELSKYGIAFYGTTKTEVGALLKQLHSQEPFAYFINVLTILKRLSTSNEFRLLHKTPYVNSYNQKEQERLGAIYAFVDARYQGKITIDEVAQLCELTKSAFCRYFKKNTGNTFIQFLNQYRVSQAKRHLAKGKTVSETCFICGFESLSYFNRSFKKITGENPSHYRREHRV